MAKKSGIIQRTKKVWQPFSKKELTTKDAREINANITGFLGLLSEWDEKEARKKIM